MVYLFDSRFEKAMEYLFDVEGGYSNHKFDNGGKTMYGITQVTYNSYLNSNKIPLRSVSELTKYEAKKIYYEKYWLKSGADKVEDFSIALILFDACVHHGINKGRSMFLKSEGNVEKFLNLRRQKYVNIVDMKPSQKVFLKGWLNRINKLENFIKNN